MSNINAPIDPEELAVIKEIEGLMGRQLPWANGWDGQHVDANLFRVEGGHVICLSIGGFEPPGSEAIKPEMNTTLPQLRVLPESIGTLKQLRMLRVGHQLIESVPETITQLNYLTHLLFSENRIRTCPSLKNLKNLERISLEYNFLEHIPEGLWNSTNLESVKLTNNAWVEADRILINQAISWGYYLYGEIRGLGIMYLLNKLFEREMGSIQNGVTFQTPQTWAKGIDRIKRGEKVSGSPMQELSARGLKSLMTLVEEWASYCIQAEDFETAEMMCTCLRDTYRWDQAYNTYMGEIRLKQKRYNEAIEFLDKITHFRLYHFYADAYLGLGDWENARRALEQIKSRDQKYAFRWGLLYLGEGSYDQAIAAFTRAKETWQYYDWNFYTPKIAQRFIEQIKTQRLNPSGNAEPAVKQCPSCSAELRRDAKFCNRCGHKI